MLFAVMMSVAVMMAVTMVAVAIVLRVMVVFATPAVTTVIMIAAVVVTVVSIPAFAVAVDAATVTFHVIAAVAIIRALIIIAVIIIIVIVITVTVPISSPLFPPRSFACSSPRFAAFPRIAVAVDRHERFAWSIVPAIESAHTVARTVLIVSAIVIRRVTHGLYTVAKFGSYALRYSCSRGLRYLAVLRLWIETRTSCVEGMIISMLSTVWRDTSVTIVVAAIVITVTVAITITITIAIIIIIAAVGPTIKLGTGRPIHFCSFCVERTSLFKASVIVAPDVARF